MSSNHFRAPAFVVLGMTLFVWGVGPALATEPPGATAGARETRAAVPGALALAAADKLVRELYGKRLDDTSTKGRKDLARELLGQARKTNDDAAGRYVLLTRCLSLAIDAADVKTASDAADELGTTYAVDAPPLAADAVRRMAPKVSGAESQSLLAGMGLKAIDALTAAGRYGEAQSLCPLVQAAGAASGDAALKARTAARAASARAAGAEFQRVKPAFDTVAAGRNDPAASDAAGRFYFAYGDAAKALPLLAKGPVKEAGGAENPWKSLAARDLSEPTSGPDQMALASAWWDLGERQPEPLKGRVQARAALWYRRALPGLEGINHLLAEKRIAAAEAASPGGEEATAAAKPEAGPPAEAPRPPARAASGVTIVSARWGGGNNWSDVTARVRERVADGKRFWANTSTLGADPTPGWRKHLQITYARNGQKKDLWVDEDQEIVLPPAGR